MDHLLSEQHAVSCGVSPFEDREEFERKCLATLRDHGFRITMPRLQVIRALAESRRAQSVQAIHQRIVDGGGHVDVVSVYRIVSLLLEAGLVHRLGAVDGYLACTVRDHDDAGSQHLVCRMCGCVVETPMDRTLSANAVQEASHWGFLASRVDVEVIGVCDHCQR